MKSIHITPLLCFKEEWFQNPEWWFDTNPMVDTYLMNAYGEWLEGSSPFDYSWENTKDLFLTWILLYDQLPRHIARVSTNDWIRPGLEKAVQLVKMVLESFESRSPFLKWEDYTGAEFGFLLLPLRHTYDPDEVYLAMKWSWLQIGVWKATGNVQNIEQFKPFLKATYQRAPMLPLNGEWEDLPAAKFVYIPAATQAAPAAAQLNDFVPWETFESILDYIPETLLEGEELPKSPSLNLPNTPCESLLVSLSGGVDSLVMLWSLLNQRHPPKLYAVFIHYCNRGDAEEAFIREICRRWNIPLYVRRIREIQRGPAMALELREIYETYTRQVRFHAYRQAHAHQQRLMGHTIPLWVAMGHNQDDCFENILTNLCFRQKYDQLSGMKEIAEIDGIYFWRPMLGVPKQTIYGIAHQQGIPYLTDSTPKWSTRGKIRDTIRPPMEALHPSLIPSFFDLSDTLREYTTFIEDIAHHWLQRTAQSGTSQTMTLKSPRVEGSQGMTSVRVWKCYLEKLFSSKQVIRQKSIQHFCDRIKQYLESKKPIRAFLTKQLEVRVRYLPNDDTTEFQFTPNHN